MQFEWLLCLASTLQASHGQKPTGVGEAMRRQEFAPTKNRKFSKTEGNKIIGPVRKEE